MKSLEGEEFANFVKSYEEFIASPEISDLIKKYAKLGKGASPKDRQL